MHASSPFQLSVVGRKEALPIFRLAGRERLGRPYRFDLVVHSLEREEPREWLRKTARLELAVGDRVRTIAGTIVGADSGVRLANAQAGSPHVWSVRLRLAPHLSRLARRIQSRVFQAATSVEIATKIFGEHGVAWTSRVAVAPPKRDVSIQHSESDLAYVTRVLAEDGITFMFLQPSEADDVATLETLVLLDAALAYEPLAGGGALRFRQSEAESAQGMVEEEHFVRAFERRAAAAVEAVSTSEFDFQKPDHPVRSDAPKEGAPLPLEHAFVQDGPYGEMQPGRRADIALGSRTRKADTAVGRTVTVRLAPGVKFALEEHPDAALDLAWTAVSVTHRADALATERPRYENDVVCVPGDLFQRPAVKPRRARQVLETATVVGPAGEEIFTDGLGRIKVQFHWDREGKNDDASSCWIRVGQPWAGAQWGHQFIPRIGMEVLIAYLGGDPDRPMCIGAVPNATHLPPFALPIEKTRSGIRTRSTGPTGGYNEISFEDAGGGEELRLRAQRDMHVHVLHDSETSIDEDAKTTIGGNHAVVVGGAQSLRVTGPSIAEYGSEAQAAFHGTVAADVTGDLQLHVGANRETRIEGADHSEVRGDRMDDVKGALTVRAGSKHLLFVGDHEVEGHAELQSTGAFVIAADRSATVTAAEHITLVCGESSIEIQPKKIVLRAAEIEILGSESVKAKGPGPSLELKDKAEIMTDALRILTKSASLELDENATLKGKAIAMTTSEPKPPVEDEKEDGESQSISLKMTDENFKPYASKEYEIRCGPVKLEGTTGNDGKLEGKVPKDAKLANVIVWIDEYPTGRRKEITLQLGKLPEISTIPGLQTRLRNLGYYTGALNGDRLDEPTSAAIQSFQRDHDIEPTGQVDDATKSAIEQRYGH